MKPRSATKRQDELDDLRDEGLNDQAADTEEMSPAQSRQHGSGSPSTSRSSGFSSSILAQSPEDALSIMFDQRVTLLTATLESLRCKCELLQEQVAESGAVSSSYAARLARSEEALRRSRLESELAKERERQLQQDVSRLEALLEAGKLQASFSDARHQAALAEERARSERLRQMRDDALLQRDNALGELSGCYADLDTLQATLADSALYVRYLRKRLLELELAAARQQQRAGGKEAEAGSSGSAGAEAAFSLGSIRAAITAAVAEAAACGEEERKKRVRALQLRWHPDKNPVLTEFATEVTKIINEAVAAMEAGVGVGVRGG